MRFKEHLRKDELNRATKLPEPTGTVKDDYRMAEPSAEPEPVGDTAETVQAKIVSAIKKK